MLLNTAQHSTTQVNATQSNKTQRNATERNTPQPRKGTTTIGRSLVAAYYKQSTTMLAARYWPPATGNIRLAAYYWHSTTRCLQQANYY